MNPFLFFPLAQVDGGPADPIGGGGGGAFTIGLPVDLASVATAVLVVGAVALGLFAALFIGFRLVRNFTRRLSVSVGGSGDTRALAWAKDYPSWGTDIRKLRKAERILTRYGYDFDDFTDSD